MKLFLKIFAIVLMTISFIGCSSGSADEPLSYGKEHHLYMSLNVTAADNGEYSRASRADDETYLVNPDYDTEKMNSLRIIIVNKSSKQIVHNYYNNFQPVNNYSVEFELDFSTQYTVYLIGNEAGLPSELQKGLNEPVYAPDALYQLILSTTDGAPFINNTNNETPIPMTGNFEFTTKPYPKDDPTDVRMEQDCFLTRALSKFSFEISDPNPTNPIYINGLKIKEIKVTQMSDKAWLFPHDAQYEPWENVAPHENLKGQIITGFTPPADIVYHEYIFYPDGFGLNGNDYNSLNPIFAPVEYFLESPATKYEIYVKAECNGLEQTFGPATLNNLPLFPRDTHVKIKLTIAPDDLIAEVDVLPYIGVWLNPTFGIDRD